MHVKNTRPNLGKLDGRSRKIIFIGYEAGSKAYHCYNTVIQHVIVSRNVVFDEAGSGAEKIFTASKKAALSHSRWSSMRRWSVAMHHPYYRRLLCHHLWGSTCCRGHEQDVDEEDLDADHDDAPLRVRSISNVI
jgi:hypothetical protein